MSYAPAEYQTQTAASLAVSEATAAPGCEPEPGSGAGQHDAWLLSFVDILILLLALFVLLLTYQQDGTGPVDTADQATADPVTETVDNTEPFRLALELPVLLPAPDIGAEIFDIKDELDGISIAGANSPEAVETNPPRTERPPLPAMTASPTAQDTAKTIAPLAPADTDNGDNTATATEDIQLQPAAQTNDPAPETSGPMEAFLDSFNSSELRDRVEVSLHGGGVNLEISDSILFTPANAALTPSGMALLEELAGALKAQPYALSIEGHTDNVPIKTARFPSNWELSTARAAIVARHLVERGISALRIRAIGYADTRPRADNLTPEGRSRNRRVSLILQVPSE